MAKDGTMRGGARVGSGRKSKALTDNRKAKCLEIKAYDYMVRFEKAFTSLESIGNANDFMVLCSTACEVTLAQDRATIEAMPNGTENLSIYSDNDIETYRDVLFYVGFQWD